MKTTKGFNTNYTKPMYAVTAGVVLYNQALEVLVMRHDGGPNGTLRLGMGWREAQELAEDLLYMAEQARKLHYKEET